MSEATTVRYTITGADRPGVTSSATELLAGFDAEVLEVEQSSVGGVLLLGIVAGVRIDDVADVSTALREAMAQRKLRVEVSDHDPAEREQSPTHVVLVLGSPVTAAVFAAIAGTTAGVSAAVDEIRSIADYPVTGIELTVTATSTSESDDARLREALAPLADEYGVDIVVTRAGLFRRAHRLVVFDVDSTLIRGEVIEMLAARAGKEDEVAAVTERAMRGELDFEASLHARVATLEGLPASVLEEVASEIVLTPGARTTIRTLRRLGIHCGVVSGGFIQIIDGLARELGLDFARANTLEVVDGHLTGRVLGEVVDRRAKARFLQEFADEIGVSDSHTVAVGDGANDIDLLTTAGLGIAFCAKPALVEAADVSLTHPFLDTVLYVLGITRDEVEAADVASGTYRRVPLGR